MFIKYLIVTFFIVTSLFAKEPIKNVVFIGNKSLSKSFIEENLNLVVEKAWFEFYKDAKPKINKKIIQPLKDSLINLYKSEGFYKVSIRVKQDKKNIKFLIKENKPLVVTNIVLKCDNDIQKLITFKKGDRFIVKKFIGIRKSIKKKLLNDGYCNANRVTKAYIDLKKYSCNLVYDIKKNKKCIFGNIEVNTQKDIPKKVILSRLYFKKGDKYSSKKIVKSYETILGLNTFDTININQKNFGNRIDIKIATTKKQALIKRTIGVGYETKYGPRIIFGWEQRDFYGGAKKLGFDMKFSKNEQYFKNTFFFPAFVKEPFFKRYIDLKNDLLLSKISYDKFDEKKLADRVHFLKDIDIISIDAGVNFERINITKYDSTACNIRGGNFILLSPYIKAIIDNRDSKIDPKNGIYISGYFESGLTYLASSTSYSKLFLEGRAIKTIYDFTIAGKAKVGLIKEFKKHLPESKLFFAGGAFSNRAYAYNRLGAFDSGCDDMGAKTIVDNSLEITHPIWKKISGSIFWDATMLSIKENEFNLDFIHSYGIGLIYNSEIGPLKLEYGVNAKDSSIYAIHFQIGQSF